MTNFKVYLIISGICAGISAGFTYNNNIFINTLGVILLAFISGCIGAMLAAEYIIDD